MKIIEGVGRLKERSTVLINFQIILHEETYSGPKNLNLLISQNFRKLRDRMIRRKQLL